MSIVVIGYCILIGNIRLIDNGKKRFVEFSKTIRRHTGNGSSDVIPLTPKAFWSFLQAIERCLSRQEYEVKLELAKQTRATTYR